MHYVSFFQGVTVLFFFDIQGHDGVAWLTERVDETMGQAYAKMRILEPSSARTMLMLHMIMCTVTQMKTTAGEGKYCLRDWRVRNIASNLGSEAGCEAYRLGRSLQGPGAVNQEADGVGNECLPEEFAWATFVGRC